MEVITREIIQEEVIREEEVIMEEVIMEVSKITREVNLRTDFSHKKKSNN